MNELMKKQITFAQKLKLKTNSQCDFNNFIHTSFFVSVREMKRDDEKDSKMQKQKLNSVRTQKTRKVTITQRLKDYYYEETILTQNVQFQPFLR